MENKPVTDAQKQELGEGSFEIPEYKLPFMKEEIWEDTKSILEKIAKKELSLRLTWNWIRSHITNYKSKDMKFSDNLFPFLKDYQDLIPNLAKLVLESPSLFSENPIKILKHGLRNSVTLSEKQCACLLAHMLFCLTVKQDDNELSKLINFFPLFTKIKYSKKPIEKLKGLFIYFKSYFSKNEENKRFITFTRLTLDKCSLFTNKFVLKSNEPISHRLLDFSIRKGKIEEVKDAVYVCFSDEDCGGRGLITGTTQQPTQFFTHPELILGVLFCERLRESEALLIQGVHQFCISDEEKFELKESDHNDSLLNEEKEVLLIDSINLKKNSDDVQARCKNLGEVSDTISYFSLNISDEPCVSEKLHFEEKAKVKQQFSEQYQRPQNHREINKFYTGFSGGYLRKKISTGNIGCGVYGGNPQLKFCLQWIGATAANKELVYNYTKDFEEYFKVDEIKEIKKRYVGMDIREFYSLILGCCEEIKQFSDQSTQREEGILRKELNGKLFKLLLKKE